MIPADGTALDLAVRRLERAVSSLEQRLAAKAAEGARAPTPVVTAVSAAPGLFDDHERARLIADLDAAREREKALEEAGEQASVALGRAIAEIRAALGDEPVANDDHDHDHGDDERQDGHAVSPEQDEDLFDNPKSDGRGEG
ncbi:DUF4164 family protein [Caulobacter sp. RL271]|uniref:DUF4164 domain-containing protein n=1 Tax=Caulobacter segnis TaxID=88688 RepID=A0ABY4ZXF6_9CAUL|nr:DUF4164 family protein [Caulobacter segnis]USQ96869.1 DUF4164 domain-containing protein [Caulobacter segnis]